MCGRFVTPEEAAIERGWHIGRQNVLKWWVAEPRYNVAPTAFVPIIYVDESGERVLEQARWGFVPHWWNKPELPRSTFNARSEEAAVKPMWRHAWRHTRCLIPTRGWYEWTDAHRIDPRTGKSKAYRQPYFIHREDGRPLAMAALYSWPPEGGEPILSCAVVTTAAFGLLADVHDRMPVVLPEHLEEAWLDRTQKDSDVVNQLVANADVSGLTLHPVDTRVNAGRGDDPGMIAPVALPDKAEH